MRKDLGTLLLLGSAHSLNHSLFLVLPPLLGDISRDLNASYKTMGVVSTVGFLIYGFGALVGGPLSDRLGEVKIARLSITFAGASTIVFLLPKSIQVFSLGIFLIAAWASFYHPTANNLIYRRFTENTASAMGIHGGAASVGQMFTPTVAYLLGIYVDWRFSFIFFGVFSVIIGFLMRRIQSSISPTPSEKTSLFKVLRVPNIWVIILYNLVAGLFYRGVELFFPTFLVVNKGFSGQVAAAANSLILLFGVFGQIGGGWAADKYSSTRVIIFSSVGMVASMFLFMLLPVKIIGVAMFIIIFGVAYFGHQPAMTELLGSVSPSNMMGTAYGLMFLFAFGLGSISTTIVGYIADVFDLETGFWTLTLLSMAVLAIAFIIPRIIKTNERTKSLQ